ncbi:MAG: nucleotidyltransferase family protein [Thermodesulfobacteriota bacterium]
MKNVAQDQVDAISRTLIIVLTKRGVKRAALFGSIVRDEMTSESDLDILIEFEGRRSLLDLAGLKLELQELLNRRVIFSPMTLSTHC